MKYIAYFIAIVIFILIGIYLKKDYQERMKVHNYHYCVNVFGLEKEHCSITYLEGGGEK